MSLWKNHQRSRMIRQQLRDRKITDPRILKAFAEVNRESFVPPDLRHMAYADRPLEIGQGQTISQPYIVALTVDQLGLSPNDHVLDVGTGGGFPGMPLAILCPQTHFHLVDSIDKKIKAIEEISIGLGLENVRITNARVQAVTDQYDFIVSRAVAQMETFVYWVKGRIAKKNMQEMKNGMLYLKGGDLEEELSRYKTAKIFSLNDFFEEDYYETKCVVHLPMKYKR